MRIVEVCPYLAEGPKPPKVCGSSCVAGRPNWWVILAVSLGLMALLVATAGGHADTGATRVRGGDAQAASRTSPHAEAAPGRPR